MSFSLFNYVYDRSMVKSRVLGLKDNIYSSLYSTFAHSQVTDSAPCDGLDWGAVFGFGFSPDGSLLAAACENRCMLLYDPNNAHLIQRRFNTHTDCVNCVRFLDNRTFATCSDDATVRLWDARFLTSEIRILRGHSSWVKNIEYSSGVGKLITSGFDGNIFGWDINNYSENEIAEPLFTINGIMRTKITPDEKTMIVSTMGGYFLLINDLELHHLKEDLKGFNSHHFWLMQMMNKPVDNSAHYNRMCHRKRNKLEFVCDFPDYDDAESISTMQVHPQGWCIVSRNTSVDEESEWTCVHDIQNLGNENKNNKSRERASSSSDAATSNYVARHSLDFQPRTLQPRTVQPRTVQPRTVQPRTVQPVSRERRVFTLHLSHLGSDNFFSNPENIRSLLNFHEAYNGLSVLSPSADDGDNTSSDAFDLGSNDLNDDPEAQEVERSPLADRDLYSSVSPAPGRYREGFSEPSLPNSEYSPHRHINRPMLVVSMAHNEENLSASQISPDDTYRYVNTHSSNSHHDRQSDSSNVGHAPSSLAVYNTPTMPGDHRERQFVYQRDVQPRLLFYSEEANVGRGFIKEQSFSADGRIIASPFGNCVRLLAFNKRCSELCDSVPTKPTALTEVGMTVSQQSSILASTFSPNHCMFVAGARDGSISFCSPKL